MILIKSQKCCLLPIFLFSLLTYFLFLLLFSSPLLSQKYQGKYKTLELSQKNDELHLAQEKIDFSFINKEKEERLQNKKDEETNSRLFRRLVELSNRQISPIRKVAFILSNLLAFSRNFFFLGVFLNQIDLLLPFLLYIQSLSLIGLWTNQKDIIKQFYSDIFCSKFDVFNLLRLLINQKKDDEEKLQIFNFYELSTYLLKNISGELIILAILLAFTLIITFLKAVLKSQRIRKIHKNLRPIWHGIVFFFMPRFATFIGFQGRSLNDGFSPFISFNILLAGVLLLFFIGFFIYYLKKLRKAIAEEKQISEVNEYFGLGFRLKSKKKFQFDCLEFSILYIPLVNYMRLFIGFLFIGFAPDFHYIQFGGIIASHLFFLLICINCTIFTLWRNNLVYSLLDFCFLIVMLLKIGVGLLLQVKEKQVANNLEKIIISVVFFSTFLYLFFIALDIRQMCLPQTEEQPKQKSKTERKSEKIEEEQTKQEEKKKKKFMTIIELSLK